jgi:hypothetical protein
MPEKGPPVYLDYDQATLDAAYDQAAYAPNREQLIKRRIRDSELARLRVSAPDSSLSHHSGLSNSRPRSRFERPGTVGGDVFASVPTKTTVPLASF